MAKKKVPAPRQKAVPQKKRAYVSQSDIPNSSLEEALRIPRAIVDNYGGQPATPLQIASALTMAPTSGGFRNLCGSSIAYGLTSGGYNATEIKLEPLARRILTPVEDGDDILAKRQAVLQPRILGEFLRKYENSPLPRDEIAANVLVDMGVPRERAAAVYVLIRDTAEAVGLLRDIKEKKYVELGAAKTTVETESGGSIAEATKSTPPPPSVSGQAAKTTQNLGQAIFVAHGKNKKPLEQLKRILDQFHIPYRLALEEPNLGRPISAKVREVMESCNCAILIFTADEEFRDKKGEPVWRPSENVVYELGASGYLYDRRIVILKEEGVEFPTNFRDLGYIAFASDQLEAKSVDVLKELIGFGIVKVST